MKAPQFWFPEENSVASWKEICLSPLSALYAYGYEIAQSNAEPYKAKIPVICVGNAIAGGGGKTPTSILLSKFLSKTFKNIAFLSRGYGGDLDGPVMVTDSHRARDVGDEPLLLQKHARTVIAKDKVEGAQFSEKHNIDLLILDDGYQNPSLHKDIHILVIDSRGFGNGKLLPAGPLREPASSALEKADIIIATEKLPDDLQDTIEDLKKPFFQSQYKALKPKSMKGSWIGFAGLANPNKVKKTLEANGYDLASFKEFPDHYTYLDEDLETLLEEAKEKGASLITTEKDFVRLKPKYKEQIQSLPIALHLEDEKAFETELQKHIKTVC